MHHENILATIGNTPLIKLNQIGKSISSKVFAKVECFNPGHSAKDRIALYMVEKAEQEGKLRPKATIIEATSGNTGYSLAMVCSLKGYQCILTVTSKASQEKLALLRSMGAQVIVCPADVEPEDPRSYYSRARQICEETPNSFYLGQNYNLNNANAHYHTTGPEIWKQTQGQITHFVCCAGTGGTLSGTARFLKEQNPKIKIIGVDAHGSVLKRYWETGSLDKSVIKSYKIEGLGKTIIPDTLDVNIIDDFIKVTDRTSANRARQLAREEGLLVGYSSGAAMQAVFQLQRKLKPRDVIVVLFPDHGSRYLGKIYNDEWMKQQGFMLPPKEEAQHYQGYKRIKSIYKAYKKRYRQLKQTFKI